MTANITTDIRKYAPLKPHDMGQQQEHVAAEQVFVARAILSVDALNFFTPDPGRRHMTAEQQEQGRLELHYRSFGSLWARAGGWR